ncbi:MAG: MGMT family protein [Candidatus Hydrothermarchaeota archaeon]|nr:MGMT family protein [Candidatus Hydrothermarchaeota archaeon]
MNIKKEIIIDTGFSTFEKEVFEKVKQIPEGRVAAYKEIARDAGRENAARAVGSALAKNPLPIVVPCHRVIKSDLSLGNFSRGKKMKKSLLRSEGVEFKGDKVKPEFLFTFYHS